MRYGLGGANEGNPGHSRGDQGRPDRIAFRAQALAFLRDDRGSGKGEITWLTMHAVSSTSRARETMGGGIGRNAFAGGSSGRRPDLAGIESSRQRCRNRSGPCLAESKSQQARAQEHEARRCQGKKSVGDYVVVAHDTPTTQMLVRIY